MALGHDVITQAQPQPGSFTARLGGEKWLKNLFLNIFRDSRAIVSHANLHYSIFNLRPYSYLRSLTPFNRLKGIIDQIQQNPSNILGNDLDLRQVISKLGLKIGIE